MDICRDIEKSGHSCYVGRFRQNQGTRTKFDGEAHCDVYLLPRPLWDQRLVGGIFIMRFHMSESLRNLNIQLSEGPRVHSGPQVGGSKVAILDETSPDEFYHII